MRFPILLATGLAVLLAGAAQFDGVARAPVDPLDEADFDFVRNRDPALWRGLSVERIAFAEGRASWRMWRIENRKQRAGPLWVVTHDNENAAFAAALRAVAIWGGTLIAIDTGIDDHDYSARYNRDVAEGSRIDPNRAFGDSTPRYTGMVLANRGARPVIALHTNALGFDPDLSTCGPTPSFAGSGAVSVELCNEKYTPRPAPDLRWPFDDADTLALLPYLSSDRLGRGWCAAQLDSAGFNMTYERVGSSDGSLSNYAVQHGIPYLNFETRDRGDDDPGIAAARDRLLAMIEVAMDRCLAPEARLMTPPAQRVTPRGHRDRALP